MLLTFPLESLARQIEQLALKQGIELQINNLQQIIPPELLLTSSWSASHRSLIRPSV